MWIRHGFQQKGRGPFGQKDGSEQDPARFEYMKPRQAPSEPRTRVKEKTRTITNNKAHGNNRKKKYISDWRRWRSQDLRSIQRFNSPRYGHDRSGGERASQETKGDTRWFSAKTAQIPVGLGGFSLRETFYFGGIDLRWATMKIRKSSSRYPDRGYAGFPTFENGQIPWKEREREKLFHQTKLRSQQGSG